MKIVIIGAGFGGLYCAKYLLKSINNIEITLLDKKNYFLFTPLLHEVATGAQSRNNVAIEIRELFKDKNFEFHATTVEKVDFNKKEVYYDDTKIKYDILVIAIGSKANFYNIQGAKEYSIPLKTIKDATTIRSHIIRSLEKSVLTKDKKERERLLTFTIVGAGATGVELAGELEEFIDQIVKNSYRSIIKKEIKIYILQKGNKIINESLDNRYMQYSMKRLNDKGIKVLLNSTVTKVSEDSIEINGKETISTKNVFWTSGITPNRIDTTQKLTNSKGYYEVNEFLEVTNNVYAIGDCAINYNPESKVPNQALAQLATKQANHLAKNISLKLKGEKQSPFIFKPTGFLVSIGQWWAIAGVGRFIFKGKFAWWLWRTVYLTKILGFTNKVRVGIEWFILLFSKRDASEI